MSSACQKYVQNRGKNGLKSTHRWCSLKYNVSQRQHNMPFLRHKDNNSVIFNLNFKLNEKEEMNS